MLSKSPKKQGTSGKQKVKEKDVERKKQDRSHYKPIIKKGSYYSCFNRCGKIIYVVKSKEKTQKVFFCSKKCANIFNGNKYKDKKKTMYECLYCKKIKYAPPSRVNIYCSKFCSNKANGKKISESRRGFVMPESTKEKLRAYRGELTSGWKGGKPKCKYCGKSVGYRHKTCDKCKVKDWTKEHREKISEAVSIKLTGRMPKNMMRPGVYQNIKRGYYNINGIDMFFRSKWEANYAIYLNWLKKNSEIRDWDYEKKVFMFERIKRGTNSYRPDFRIINNNGSEEYHEIKGYMTPRSKTQIKRMSIYYPDVKLILIDGKSYRDIASKIGKVVGFYE